MSFVIFLRRKDVIISKIINSNDILYQNDCLAPTRDEINDEEVSHDVFQHRYTIHMSVTLKSFRKFSKKFRIVFHWHKKGEFPGWKLQFPSLTNWNEETFHFVIFFQIINLSLKLEKWLILHLEIGNTP